MEGYNRDASISADVISDSNSEIKIPNPREEWVQSFMREDALKLIGVRRERHIIRMYLTSNCWIHS